MKEKVPQYNFLVAVDNYLVKYFKGSFVKGVIVQYMNSNATLYVNENNIQVSISRKELFSMFILNQ